METSIRTQVARSLAIGVTVLCAVLLYNQFGLKRNADAGDAGAPTYSVSGRAVAADGQPPPGMRIRLRGLDDGRVRSVTVPAKPDGSFSATGLAPGLYTISAFAPGTGDGAADVEIGTAEVTVGNADLSGVTIPLRRP